ncbi:universal stress protein [Massilia cellulosiltytica]|uniref:universal stress protein n=1 Tax=Massilia cellulosiltytica TaxID=2683234 RepID=UPI0039B42658
MLKTILVHVDQSVHAPARMRYAAALARAAGADLVGAAMFGVSRTVFPNGYSDPPGTLGAGYFQPLADHARHALARFEAIASEMQVRHEQRFICDQADDGLGRLARFADLVVVSQDDPAESLPDMTAHLPESLILNSARPVIVVPRTDPAPWRGGKALVAWDGSKEASFALSASLPLLRRSSEVVVVTLVAGAPDEDAFRTEQADLQHFLRRHHITPRMLVRAQHQDTGHDLLALADGNGCSLLVMGCFGHGRFRELCLGGASRTVLADARVPVLFAH